MLKNVNRRVKKALEEALSLSLKNKEHFDKLFHFFNFLIKKNLDLNLISRKLNHNNIIWDHFYDCLVGSEYFKTYNSITDIGTGGGLPGIILSIIFPKTKLYLVEKSKKKSMFLEQTKKELCLSNVEVCNCVINDYHISSDVVTCRAFKPIDVLLSYTTDYFNTGRKYILYKGKKETISNEINIASSKYLIDYKINKINEIKEKERNIVIIKKKMKY